MRVIIGNYATGERTIIEVEAPGAIASNECLGIDGHSRIADTHAGSASVAHQPPESASEPE